MRAIATRCNVAKAVVLAMVAVPPIFVFLLASSGNIEAIAYVLLFATSTGLALSLPTWAWIAWLHAMLTPVAIAWIGFVWLFDAAPHLSTIDVIRSTSVAEIVTWLEGRLILLTVVMLVLAVVLWAAGLATCLPASPKPKKAWAATGLVALMLLLSWHTMVSQTSGQKEDGVDVASRKAWPSGLFLLAGDFVAANFAEGERTSISVPMGPLTFVPQVAKQATDGMRVVFVIGESHRGDFMSPSDRPDLVPGLRKYLDAGKLVEFRDVASASNLTTYSVPAMITGTRSEDLVAGVRRQPSGLKYFAQAGFSTAWLSNQSDGMFSEAGLGLTFYPSSLRFIRHDDVLVPPLRQVVGLGRTHSAIVLHMMGSHFDYERRYPSSFREAPSKSLPNETYVRRNYENSVSYSAKVLEDILQLTLDTQAPAVVLFSSDHGENLLDDARQLIWHGGSSPPTRVEFHSATWIAWNNSWAEAFPHLVGALKALAQKPLSHEHLLGIWLTVGGLVDSSGNQIPSVLNGEVVPAPAGERIVYSAGKKYALKDLR